MFMHNHTDLRVGIKTFWIVDNRTTFTSKYLDSGEHDWEKRIHPLKKIPKAEMKITLNKPQ